MLSQSPVQKGIEVKLKGHAGAVITAPKRCSPGAARPPMVFGATREQTGGAGQTRLLAAGQQRIGGDKNMQQPPHVWRATAGTK
jgi:hypothetical protein